MNDLINLICIIVISIIIFYLIFKKDKYCEPYYVENKNTEEKEFMCNNHIDKFIIDFFDNLNDYEKNKIENIIDNKKDVIEFDLKNIKDEKNKTNIYNLLYRNNMIQKQKTTSEKELEKKEIYSIGIKEKDKSYYIYKDINNVRIREGLQEEWEFIKIKPDGTSEEKKEYNIKLKNEELYLFSNDDDDDDEVKINKGLNQDTDKAYIWIKNETDSSDNSYTIKSLKNNKFLSVNSVEGEQIVNLNKTETIWNLVSTIEEEEKKEIIEEPVFVSTISPEIIINDEYIIKVVKKNKRRKRKKLIIKVRKDNPKFDLGIIDIGKVGVSTK